MPRFYRKKVMQIVRDRWGKESTPAVDFKDLEENYVHMMKKDDWILDDQTWNDLDMNANFMRLDRTMSNSGQQQFYNMLRTLSFDEKELKRRDRLITFFQMNKDWREKMQCLLYFLDKEEYDSAASVLFRKSPELPPQRAWVIPCTIGMIASILSIPFWGARSILLIAIFFVINLLVHNSINRYTQQALPGLRYIVRMLAVAKELKDQDIPELKEDYLTFFDKVVDKCAPILRKTRDLGNGGSDPLGISLYLQIFFLTEARAYLRCCVLLEEDAPALRTLYRKLGELDAYIGMASVRRGLRHYSKPVFTEEKNVFEVTKMGHPTLKNAVCNDISICKENVVLTGSNMSGKSTFLRTIGLNVLLAQTFYTTMTKSYKASMFHMATSISPSDDLMEGKSYYMAEATALLRMLGILEEDMSSLLLIDEIFRGTNPTERVAGASSLLQYLAERNCLVVVATHDIEITEKVKERYHSYHFEEKVTKDSLEFDYLLKEGTLTKPNGIRILEYLGYPEEITQRALEEVSNAFRDPYENDETL